MSHADQNNLQDHEASATPVTTEIVTAFGERFRSARRSWLITVPIAFAIAFCGMVVGVILQLAYGRGGIFVVLAIWSIALSINWTAAWRLSLLRCPRCGERFSV